jgi:hypothetical protein
MLDQVPDLGALRDNVRSIAQYSFTEMLNNAIEHSQGMEADVILFLLTDQAAFIVADDGIGVFRNLRERFRFEDDFAAIQHLAKGKLTTQPQGHTGEGIFFTSRAVDLFELESGGLRWIVDTPRGDQAIGEAPARPGTRVRCAIDPSSHRSLQDVFGAHTDPESLRFTRSMVRIDLFKTGDRFISRPEARRIGTGLERFGEVVLDFQGVREVGQGFVDELFRVWTRDHPNTRLIPINMSPVIEAMIRRGLPP